MTGARGPSAAGAGCPELSEGVPSVPIAHVWLAPAAAALDLTFGIAAGPVFRSADVPSCTVRIMHATLRVMLNAAVDDGVILANPADRLGRQMRLVTSRATRQEKIKAFNRGQVEQFLAATLDRERRFYPLFFLLARTGLRLGEALALRWDDVDLQ